MSETMSKMELDMLTDRIKGMSEEELNATVKLLPSQLMFEELMRREKHLTEIIEKVHSIINT